MAQNYRESGERLDYVVGTGETITSGQVVIIGNMVGIALGSGVEGDTVVVHMEGVYEIAKTAPLVITQGDTLYFDTATDKVTKTVTDARIGTAWEGAASAATTCFVKISEDGKAGNIAANVAAEATANGSDAATTQALANALKTKVNAILTALKAGGVMVAD